MSFVAQNAINTKIASRIHAEQEPPMALDARAMDTRYTLMPIVDPRRNISGADIAVPGLGLESGLNRMIPSSVRPSQMNPLPKRQPVYDMTNGFVPIATGRGPWSGYAAHINTETALRGQTYALQRCPQAGYVPDSSDRMYDQNIEQPESRKGPRGLSGPLNNGGFYQNSRMLPDPRA